MAGGLVVIQPEAMLEKSVEFSITFLGNPGTWQTLSEQICLMGPCTEYWSNNRAIVNVHRWNYLTKLNSNNMRNGWEFSRNRRAFRYCVLPYTSHTTGIGIHSNHNDVIKWNLDPRHLPFVRGIHRSPVDSPHKAIDTDLWCFLWCTNGWVNNQDAGDLRCHEPNYNVTVMWKRCSAGFSSTHRSW